MKKILPLIILLPCWVFGQDLKKNEFSISLGYMFEGEMYADEVDAYFSVGETILIRAEDNFFLSDHIGIGVYYTLGFPFYSAYYEEVTMQELGAVIKGRIPAGEKFVIKPGVYVGYRLYSGDNYLGIGPGNGMALNATVAAQYAISAKIKPFVDLGIVTQPLGGNEETNITYGPTFQMNFGITF